MIVKGYVAQIRIARIEGADNRPVSIAESIQPIPYTSVMSGDFMGKSIIQGMAIDAFVRASEAERGGKHALTDGEKSAAVIADQLQTLAAMIRD